MAVTIHHSNSIKEGISSVIIFDEIDQLTSLIDEKQREFIDSQLKNKQQLIEISHLSNRTIYIKTPVDDNDFIYSEKLRIKGFEVCKLFKSVKPSQIQITTVTGNANTIIYVAEGMYLSSYDFNKYKSDKKDFDTKLILVSENLNSNDSDQLQNILSSNHIARDFVNEPQSYLNTIQYSKDLDAFCSQFGIKYSKFDKDKITQLGMGGLLAVNQGSVTPPIFNILEYKPSGAINEKPLVLIGKGVVYDTGGLSLKPTPNSMDMMKCDMGGSAAVAGAIFAIAQNKLPIHVISLIAATDNRPGGDAYAPGDVITMYNGKTVEVLNTDAEGRLTLGDALTYADELEPELVIDLATLTGAAARAIGKQASVVMGNAPAEVMVMLQESGMKCHERLVEFPLYDEYNDDIKSDIADMKNLGGAEAGATTAGMFLQNFTNSPWIHIDIAGTAFLTSEDKYRGKNATGVGVRLLYQFVKDYYNVG